MALPRIECVSEPKAILLARVAVAKRIAKGNVSPKGAMMYALFHIERERVSFLLCSLGVDSTLLQMHRI